MNHVTSFRAHLPLRTARAMSLTLLLGAIPANAAKSSTDVPIIAVGGVKRAVLGNVLRAGDCRMRADSYLEFRPDGTGSFYAVTWTEKTFFGDVWHQDMMVFPTDAANNHFRLEGWESPVMRFVQPWLRTYSWEAQFTFPAANYPFINTVQWNGDC